jgi:molecular chaperone GrpE
MNEDREKETLCENVEEIIEEQESELEKRIQFLEKENAEYKDKWLRIAAEFDNYRRRTASEKCDWIKNATQKLVLELCDVNDNFERAFQRNGSPEDPLSFRKGMEMIHKQIDSILQKEGVEKIITEGVKFDPAFHDALVNVPSEQAENTIAAVIQNGYKMNGKVIRAARVAVANGEKPPKTENKKKVNNKK